MERVTKARRAAKISIKATCKGAGVTLVPPLTDPVEVFLQMGSQAYCAAAQGSKVKKNKTGQFQAKVAAAPAQCAAAT